MSTPGAAQGLDSRAIGIGAAVGIGASLATSMLWVLFPRDAVAANLSLIVAINQLTGAVIDIATGATAGWLAGRRGSMHGLFAGLISNIASLAIGYTMTVLRTDYGDTVEEVIAYLMALVPWQIVGVALATIAGAVAVRFAQRRAV